MRATIRVPLGITDTIHAPFTHTHQNAATPVHLDFPDFPSTCTLLYDIVLTLWLSIGIVEIARALKAKCLKPVTLKLQMIVK